MFKKELFSIMASIWLLMWGIAFGAEEGHVKRTSAMPEEYTWGRNPFLTKAEIESLQGKKEEVEEEVVEEKGWEVKTILISDSSRVAIINNQIVTVGDFIGREEVLEINEESVVIGRGKNRWIIKPTQPLVRIEEKE